MKSEIKVPPLGESVSEASVSVIIKESGSSVAVDDEILELETDKVNQILYASEAGTLTLNVSLDQTVKIGDTIGTIEVGAKASPAAKSVKELPKASKKSESVSLTAAEVSPVAPLTGGGIRRKRSAFISAAKHPSPKNSSPKNPVPAVAQNIVSNAPPSAPPPEYAIQPGPSEERVESRQKMTKIRKVIAARLLEAQATTAMLTTFNEVNMGPVMDLRKRYKEDFEKRHNARLGFMSFFVKATVLALQGIPAINAYIDGEDLVYREYYDIGIAVSSPKGLIVPVLRNCDILTLADIEKAIMHYALQARAGKLTVDTLQGGGFTITNGGIFGSLLSTPILNPPQCGILGMHKIQERPVAVNGKVEIYPMMYLALSYDHRVVDGKEAVTFLVHIKNMLEDPARFLLGL